MAFTFELIQNKSQIKEFHQLPFRIYKDYPNWIPPLEMEIEAIFNPEKNSFFSHGECERYLVKDAGITVGRFCVMTNEKKDHLYSPKTGGMGFLEMDNDPLLASAIIDFCKNWHKVRGNGAFRGPVNFGENDNYWGLLIENYDEPPIYGMYYHPPYYRKLLEDTGAEKLDDHWSYKRMFADPLPERLAKITDRIESRPGVELRPIDIKNIQKDAEAIRYIYNEAWRTQDIAEREADFSELTEEAVNEMVKKLKPVMIQDSVLIAFVNGEPASFIVCIPDLNEISLETGGKLKWWHLPKVLRFKKRATRLRTLVYGTLPKYRKMGLEALTFVRGIQWTYAAAPTLEYLEGTWVSEKNWLMQRSLEALGCHHHKTHRSYRWLID